uniref:Putative secreted protein n=1 Tax=Anopheles triannulatus TaxID=58253 RepID=A0A2M4B6L6_9DIPT
MFMVLCAVCVLCVRLCSLSRQRKQSQKCRLLRCLTRSAIVATQRVSENPQFNEITRNRRTLTLGPSTNS